MRVNKNSNSYIYDGYKCSSIIKLTRVKGLTHNFHDFFTFISILQKLKENLKRKLWNFTPGTKF